MARTLERQMPFPVDRIAANYQRVVERSGDAALRSGRRPETVRVVAVTKTVGVELIEPLIACGCVDIGESRPQQLWEKAKQIGANVRWHMIGHLQRNKVDRTIPLISCLHSVDSPRLFGAINASAQKLQLPPVPALLEINISGDATKHGLTPDAACEIVQSLALVEHVAICGLMGMASFVDDERIVRAQFASLRELRDNLSSDMPAGHTMRELSMGMSGDFEIAIEEGATIVRVGSALFEGCGS